jgi:hypothetical protein
MMLLTFESYAHIPDKIHVFYDVAFTTLFSRHDALKEAFKREKYTKFSIDVFKTQLSCLCVLTYQDERFSFSEAELLSYIVKSAVLSNKTFVAEDFMKDLLESVCIMQQDGIEVTFSHRSFQEYFTAVYLENMPREELKALLPRLAKRGTDSVFTMFNDMNHELLEESYIMPMIKKAKRVRRGIGSLSSAIDIINAYRVEILITPRPVVRLAGCSFYLTDNQQNEVWRFRELSMRLYRDMYSVIFSRYEVYVNEDKQISKKIPADVFEKAERDKLITLSRQSRDGDTPLLTSDQLFLMRDLFEQSGSAHLLIDTEACFGKFLEETPKNNRRRSKRVREVLRIS